MDSSPSSFSFHSVALSFPESSLLDAQTPLLSQSEITHLPDSPFADPPILPSTSPSFRHSVKHSPGTPRFHSISPKSGVSDDASSNYCRGYGFGPSRGPRKCSDLDPLRMSPRVRSCDVYIGAYGRTPAMVRFIKWLRAELERQGVLCFVVDRSRCRSAYDHGIAKVAMDVASFGVVVIMKRSFSSPYSMEEIRVFLAKKRLVPIFFELTQLECSTRDIVERRGGMWERDGGRLWEFYGGLESDWKEAVNGISRLNLKLEANSSNFRDCISEAVVMLGTGLGRSKVVESIKSWKNMETEELPFRRNPNFVGRNKELLDLEMILFGDVVERKDGSNESKTHRRHRRKEAAMSGRIEKESAERRRKGKEPMVLEESAEQIELERYTSINGRILQLEHGKGIVCVTGDSGIGKTELLLEYAYRFSQSYKMILWVGGESRYLRQNYMKLLPILGIDTNIEDKLYVDRSQPQSLEDIEEEAIRKVRKELMRDIPYLLVIDNLEREEDWWDGKNITELLPYLREATHVLISTRLPRVMNIEPMRLLYLSIAEGMLLLMKGSENDLDVKEADSLRLIEEKAGRLPFGLALVGTVLSEFSIKPSKLLNAVNNMPYEEVTWATVEDQSLKHNPFLLQLLDFIFSIWDHESSMLAMQIIQANAFFAPSPIPSSMLALTARYSFGQRQNNWSWMKPRGIATCMCVQKSNARSSEAEVISMLVKFQIAKACTKPDYVTFHDIVKLYANKRSSRSITDSIMRTVSVKASIPEHLDHIWAASFLLFKFDSDQVVVNLPINDLLLFIEKFVLPLALHSLNASFCYNAVLELLRLATETLETIESSFLSEDHNNLASSSCWRRSDSRSTLLSQPLLYQKSAHLRATLLETRSKIMLRGGLYDIGERLCKTAVDIKEVIYGLEHPETVSTRETLEKLSRLLSSL